MRPEAETRKTVVAGQFYDSDPVRLRADFAAYLQDAPAPPLPQGCLLRVLVVPHAGYAYSGGTAARAYATAAMGDYKRLVLLTPSHYVGFAGLALPSYSSCETPLGPVKVDIAAVESLSKADLRLIGHNYRAHSLEHSLEVQLPLMRHFFPDTPLLPIVCGQIDRDMAAKAAADLLPLWGEDSLWIVSSDFTHYGESFNYMPFDHDIPAKLRELDLGAVDHILAQDAHAFDRYVKSTGATICGAAPILVALEVAALAAKARKEVLEGALLEYVTSGAMTGDYTHSVSYAAVALYQKP